MLLIEVDSLKNPVAQGSHLGWAVVEPLVLVYLPGGHLVWRVQASGLVLFSDGSDLKNPSSHASHENPPLVFFAVFLYDPGGQSIEVAREIWDTITDCNNVTTTRVHPKRILNAICCFDVNFRKVSVFLGWT